MKKKLIAGLLVFTMAVSSVMPVMAAPKAKKIAIKGKKTVTVGKTIELDSVITPKKAKIKDRNIIWTSSKPSVAKVLEKRDDDTKIKGMKAGTATITVRIKGTSIKKKYKITVKKAPKSTAKTSSSYAAAEKSISTYSKEAKALKKEISKIQLADTFEQRRIQYHNYERKIEAIEKKLDRLDDKWEDKWEDGKISHSKYRKLESKIDKVEDYLDGLEDYLEQKFNYEFD